MSGTLPRVAFGSTLLDRGLAIGGIDGIGQYCQELLNQFSSQQERVAIKPFSFGVMQTYSSATIFPNYPGYLANTLVGNNPVAVKQFFDHVDLIHATDQLIPIRHHKPLVSTVMDVIPLSHPEYLRSSSRMIKPWLWKKLTQQSDHIITISEYSKQEIHRLMNFPMEKMSTIPLGVDKRYFERISPTLIQNVLKKFQLDKPFFLFIGSIQPRKNLQRLIQAHASLPRHLSKEFPLVIVGKLAWNDGQTIAEIEKAISEERCVWLDYITDIEKRCLLQASLALIFASLYEGFGLPILEGFASSTPVITSNTTSMPEVAADAALTVNPLDIDSIREAYLSLIENPSLLEEMKIKGLTRARLFSWEQAAKSTLSVYQSLL